MFARQTTEYGHTELQYKTLQNHVKYIGSLGILVIHRTSTEIRS